MIIIQYQANLEDDDSLLLLMKVKDSQHLVSLGKPKLEMETYGSSIG